LRGLKLYTGELIVLFMLCRLIEIVLDLFWNDRVRISFFNFFLKLIKSSIVKIIHFTFNIIST